MVAFGVIDFDTARRTIASFSSCSSSAMIVLGYLDLSGFFDLVERRVLALAGSARACCGSSSDRRVSCRRSSEHFRLPDAAPIVVRGAAVRHRRRLSSRS
jgi:hypothetical protein